MERHSHASEGQALLRSLLVTAPRTAVYYVETPEGVVLNVRAQPRSSRAGIDGLIGDAVKVRVKCAPVDGKANRELVETLADAFGIAKGMVVFKGGETSKAKRILLRGVTAQALAAAAIDRKAGDIVK